MWTLQLFHVCLQSKVHQWHWLRWNMESSFAAVTFNPPLLHTVVTFGLPRPAAWRPYMALCVRVCARAPWLFADEPGRGPSGLFQSCTLSLVKQTAISFCHRAAKNQRDVLDILHLQHVFISRSVSVWKSRTVKTSCSECCESEAGSSADLKCS